jgi:hypothetical protein
MRVAQTEKLLMTPSSEEGIRSDLFGRSTH